MVLRLRSDWKDGSFWSGVEGLVFIVEEGAEVVGLRGLKSEELRCKELLGLSLTMCTLNVGTELNTKLSRPLSCLSQGLFAGEAPLKH